MHILIAEDVVKERSQWKKWLAEMNPAWTEGQGAISEANSHGLAIRLGKEEPPDLVLLDVMMPDEPGQPLSDFIDTIHELKTLPGKTPWVILITAVVSAPVPGGKPYDTKRLEELADAVLVKPVPKGRFQETVHRVMNAAPRKWPRP